MKAKTNHLIRAGLGVLLLLVPLACRAEEKATQNVLPGSVQDAEENPEPKVEKKNADIPLSREELRTLLFLSSLPEEKLASLKQSIVQLEAMTPDERAELNKLWEAGERERMRLLRETREKNWLALYWDSLPPEASEAEKKKFMSLDNEGRRTYVVELRKKIPAPGTQRPGKNPGGNVEGPRPPWRPGQEPGGPPPAPMEKNIGEDSF